MAEIVAVIGLAAVFAIAMWRSLNMGAVALVAAFLLGSFYFGQGPDDIVAAFPGSLFVTLVGVTFLFGIARANGTIDQIVGSAVGAVRGRLALVPWVFFILAAIITGAGALSAATNAILAPVGLAFARRYRISPLMVGLSILNGTNAGGFSPISVYFSIVNGALRSNGLQVAAGPVFLLVFVANLVLNVAVFLLLGGPELIRRRRDGDDSSDSMRLVSGPARSVGTVATTTTRWTVEQGLTVVVMAGIVVAALGLAIDVGFLALTAAVLLGALYPTQAKKATREIGWDVILLIGGIVTYIGMLQSAGVIQQFAASVNGISSPLIATFVILVVAAAASAFASTNAMFVVVVPLAAPLLTEGAVGILGLVVALCISASAVDTSPFSTGGALVVANVQEERRDATFRGLLLWGMSMIVVAPVLSWLTFVVL